MTISGGGGRTLVLGLVGTWISRLGFEKRFVRVGLGRRLGRGHDVSFIAWVLGGRDRLGDWFGHFGQKGVLL